MKKIKAFMTNVFIAALLLIGSVVGVGVLTLVARLYFEIIKFCWI